jgi:3-oxoadipate enol-lactonase
MESAVKSRSVQVNGINISYDDTGNSDIPLIFIHGFPFSKAAWQPQIDSLKKHYRVIAYDIRGFGGTNLGTLPVSIDLFATDLIEFMDALDIRKAFACGLSMGGYVLMNAAGRFPERFEAIILSDTQCIADSEENREKRLKTIEQVKKDGLTGFADNYVKNVLCPNTLEKKPDVVEKVKQLILKTSPESIIRTLKALAERKETCNSLKHLSLPALIICGKEDTVTPLSQSELMNNALTNSTLQTIGEAGHLSNLEQPEIFNEHIHNFLPGFLS